ncbi:MAG TPA: J domain-containing protein [Kofleriaceae bacterium]|nr:J domain-containing protein [Kofleriaceae bacterium]
MREHPRTIGRGELVRLVYRLGRQHASGVLTIRAQPRDEVFVLRRGHAIAGDGEIARRLVVSRLVRLASHACTVTFEGGVAGLQPPGAGHGVALAAWARSQLEAQLDSSLADALLRELAGMRLSIRAELAPEPHDEADRRMLAAMVQPRRLDQIWPLARTPRFRLLAFLHFLRAVDALEVEGIVAEQSAPHRRAIDPARVAALRLLGITDEADVDAVKRAYRRLARALHPDLQPELDLARRRSLERRFAEVTAAYETLTGS